MTNKANGEMTADNWEKYFDDKFRKPNYVFTQDHYGHGQTHLKGYKYKLDTLTVKNFIRKLLKDVSK